MKSLIVSGLSVEAQLKTRWEALDPQTTWEQLIQQVAEVAEKNNLDTNDAVDLLEEHIEKAERKA